MLKLAHRGLEALLEWVVILLMVTLTVIVMVAVLFRFAGDSLTWYDEVAAILLSWITYYGAALAALKRRHIGFDTVLLGIPMPYRMGALILAEIAVIWFFYILCVTGMEVLAVLEGMSLDSLTWVPVQFTQSVIPIGAGLFILCELVSLPEYWRQTAAGVSLEHAEIEEEVEHELEAARTHRPDAFDRSPRP